MAQLSYLNPSPKLDLLPNADRPARRVAEAPTACNAIELLAALFGGQHQIEIAERLMFRFGSLRAIRQANPCELTEVQGMGPSSAVRLISALELGRRLAIDIEEEQPAIHSPADAAALIQYDMGLLEQEELWVLVLNTRNRLMSIDKLYRGSVNSSLIRVGEIFRTAIRYNAAAILVAHSHPSGDPTPSPDDIAVTRAIVEAGRLLDISTLDHLVIGQGRWVSLKERKMGFN